MQAKQKRTDARVVNLQTIYLLHLYTRDAKRWAKRHIVEDPIRYEGALVVEHRCIADIVQAMRDAGLQVHED